MICKKKKKTSNLVWIIIGTITLIGIGTITYFAWSKKVAKTETKSQTGQEKTQQLQNQLSQIKQSLNQLSDASKKTQITTQITDIEEKLKQISQQNNQEQEKVIKQLEESIKAINQKIDKKDNPSNDKPPEIPDPQPENNSPFNYVSTKIDDNTYKYQINTNGKPIPYSIFISFLKLGSKKFFQVFQRALKDANAKFPAYFWKCPPVSKNTLDKIFEFVVIKSDNLNNITQDYSSFDDYLAKIHGKDKPSVISFPNNSNPSDAILVIPAFKLKDKKMLDYKNISQFTKNASDEQQQEFWQEVAKKLSEELEKDDTPRWLNTHGLGVRYLHVRIDEGPKYYGDYFEYKYL